jgi:hypothetical protein
VIYAIVNGTVTREAEQREDVRGRSTMSLHMEVAEGPYRIDTVATFFDPAAKAAAALMRVGDTITLSGNLCVRRGGRDQEPGLMLRVHRVLMPATADAL